MSFSSRQHLLGIRAALSIMLCCLLGLSACGSSTSRTISEYQDDRFTVAVIDECQVKTDDGNGLSGEGEIGDTETNAKKIYAVLHELGLADENIAGLLGNWSTESGIDPSSIEADYLFAPGEDFSIDGPGKQAIMADWEGYTLNKVFPQYARDGLSINQDAYKGDDGKYYPGVGLGGFTGPNCTKLFSFADQCGYGWYTMDCQLLFSVTMPDEGGYGRTEWLLNWEPESSASNAASSFLSNWEGNPGMMLGERTTAAEDWLSKMHDGTLKADSSYAKSLLSHKSGSSNGSGGNTGQSSSPSSSKKKTTTKAGTTRTEGEKHDIPDEYDGIQQNYGYGGGYEIIVNGVHTSAGWCCWKTYEGPQGDVARKWLEQGKKTAVDGHIPVIDGRGGVVLKAEYGEAGDYVDIVYKDGNVFHGIIIDTQGASDDAGGVVAWSQWGHNTSDQKCNVTEWYDDGDGGNLVSGGTNPCTIKGLEYITGTVDYIVNTKGVNTGGVMDGTTAEKTVTDEACEDKEEEEGINVAAGEAAKVDPSTSARLEWLYGSAGVPKSDAENQKWLETFDVKIRDQDGNQTTFSMTMHKKLVTEVQALFEDIYNNTDFKINTGDTGSLRPWDSEAGKYVEPQTNSNHAYGLAMDINAMNNYYISSSGATVGNSYNPGKDPLAVTDKVVEIFKKHGFFWGGDWTDPKDYMHFAYTDH